MTATAATTAAASATSDKENDTYLFGFHLSQYKDEGIEPTD